MGCNINYYGGDFESGPGFQNGFNDSLGGCQYACDSDSNCRAWTWLKNTSACWLKGVKNPAINDTNAISGAKGTTGDGGTDGGTGGSTGIGTINVSFQCSGSNVNAITSWSPDPTQVALLADGPPGAPIEKNISVGSGTSGITVTGLAPSTPVNFSVIGPGFSELRKNEGGVTPSCGTGGSSGGTGGNTNPTATKIPTKTPTKTPVPTKNPTATSIPAQPTATTAPGQPTATPIQSGPTATTAPNETRIALSLIIPGIGERENVNPNPSTRTAEIQTYNTAGDLVKSGSGQITFDQNTLTFKGTVSLGTIESGIYRIKVRIDNSLWKAINGISLTSGQTTNTQNLKLITGDLNQDNILNLLDYNAMLACYGTKQCAQKTKADLNMDSAVDEKDLNILYVAFSSREGD
jgi:hypothetical protein